MALSLRKLLSYPIYSIRIDIDAHVWVFWKAIQVNGEKQNVDIVNLVCFTLRYVISKWGENFMQSHPNCILLELETTSCKLYCTIQNSEHVYMAFRIIKQGSNIKVEVYYEWILKLANCFQHKVNDNLLTTFFWARLVPYLWITIIGMKWDTLFEHKKIMVTCEETMVDVKEYWKLLEPRRKPKKQKKTFKLKRCVVFVINQGI
jgi:hypothetical protein